MPAISLDDAQDAYDGDKEPLPKWLWRVKSMPSFGGRKLLAEKIINASIPFEELGIKSKVTAASNISMPDMSSVSSISLTVMEDSLGRTLEYFVTWQEHVQNPHSGGFYKPPNYKRDLEFELYNAKGEVAITVVVRQAWVSAIGELSLDQSSEFHQYTVTMPVDAVYPKAKG